MKIGLITTLNTNIGDDFIRKGICDLLENQFGKDRINFISVNKHKPFSVYPNWHPIHSSRISSILPIGQRTVRNAIENLLSKIKLSTFDNCDLIVQCGAPVFWEGCYQNEWAKPIWHDIIGRIYEKTPVFNLAAGSCYPWEKQPSVIENEGDRKYIKSILKFCRLTTVRDKLAASICGSLGSDVPLVPCSAFLAAKGKIAPVKDSDYIMINYMAGGGHFDWGNQAVAKEWESTIKCLISRLRKRHKIAFLCHNQTEDSLAQEIAPDLPRFLPRTPQEYFDCVAHAKFGLCNRMHASVGMAGLGISSIAICTDTRLLMVAELGLPIHYVKDVEADRLESEIENVLCLRQGEKERLIALQKKTFETYGRLIEESLN